MSRKLLVEQELLELMHSYPNSGTKSLSALLQGKLYKISLEISSISAIHGPEQNSYYALRTDFYVDSIISPTTSKINLWIPLDQLPMFWTFADFVSLASCLSKLSLISWLWSYGTWILTVLVVHHLDLARHS